MAHRVPHKAVTINCQIPRLVSWRRRICAKNVPNSMLYTLFITPSYIITLLLKAAP